MKGKTIYLQKKEEEILKKTAKDKSLSESAVIRTLLQKFANKL